MTQPEPTFTPIPQQPSAPAPKKISTCGVVVIVFGVLLGICLFLGFMTTVLQGIGILPKDTPVPTWTAEPLPTAHYASPATLFPTIDTSNNVTPIAIPAGNSIAQVRETVEQQGYKLTVESVEFADNYNSFNTAGAGNHFMAIDILIESNAPSNVNVNPFYFKVKDSDGYEYDATIAGKDPSLKSQNNLLQGEKMRGWVTFEVPISGHGFVMSFQPIQFGNTVRILVDLGQ